MKTRLLSLLLTIMAASMPASAYDFMVNGLCYNFNSDGTSVTLTHQYSSIGYWDLNGALTIPASVTYNGKSYSVTSIGRSAFYNCTGLTSVTIPNSVTIIEGAAFLNCSGLTSVTIPNSVTIIEDDVFKNCTGLTSVTIPNSVTTIYSYAFEGCQNITTLTIGKSLTEIQANAFRNCKNLATVNWNAVDFPAPSYQNSPFSGLTNITTFNVGNTVKKLPSYLCKGLTSITTVTMGNSVTEVKNTFYGCTGLTRVNISDLAKWCNIDFKDITGNPLYYAHNLYLNGTKITNLTIPSSITTVKQYTFCQLKSLTQLTIPSTVSQIEVCAFYGCTGLTTVSWNASACDDFTTNTRPFDELTSIKTFNFGNTVTRIPEDLCDGLTGLTTVTIPSSVTSIGAFAFYNCTGLTTVTMGNSVSSIGRLAFNGCTGLTRVNISDLAKWCSIDFSYGFSGETTSNPLYYAHNLYLNGSKITNLTIPSTVTAVKQLAFYNCTPLTSVTIPSSVTEIGNQVFIGCTGLTNVNWNAASCADLSSSSDAPFNGLTNIKTFSFGNTVKNIPAYLCYNLSGLTSVSIPSSVTSVGNSAFMGCSGLATVNWNAANCSDFYYSATPFKGMTNIKTFNFGNTVIRIPSYLCYNLSGLTTVNIPSSVTTIGMDAFVNCSSLNKVEISNLANWCNIDFSSTASNPLYFAKNLYLNGTKITALIFPNTMTKIKNYSFYNCEGLTSVTIPNSITSIGWCAFYGCTGLTSIILPNSVTTIGYSAFKNCSGLASVIVSASVNNIENDAFNGCSNLMTAVSKIANPQNVNYGNYISNLFGGIPEASTLYVPKGTIDSYQLEQYNNNTNPWLAFGEVHELVDGDVDLDGMVTSADVTAIYNCILNNDIEHHATCDINGDGNITAADITALYNIILN